MRAAFLLVLVLAPDVAHAEGRWIGGVQAGAVGSRVDYADDYEKAASQLSTSLVVEGSRVVHPRIAIGARVGVDGAVVRTAYDFRSMFDSEYDVEYRPILIGAAATVFPSRRTWVTPWLGLAHDWDRQQCTTTYPDIGPRTRSCGDVSETARDNGFAYGVGAGIDLFAAAPHRVGVAASITRARGEYTSVGLSVGYRYW